MTADTRPSFVPVPLTDLMNVGVLMAANERFFWPLGLALTWEVDTDLSEAERVATNLHVRQWDYGDGHHEAIETGADGVTLARRAAFAAWLSERVASMPITDEAAAAEALR